MATTVLHIISDTHQSESAMGYSDYSDDDYNDNGDDHYQFNEDDLNDEEYDLLYDLLPSFKSKVVSKNYKINDLVLKEYLWESNFNVDDAIQLVLDNHKRMYQCFCFPFLFSFFFFFLISNISFPFFFSPFHVHLSKIQREE